MPAWWGRKSTKSKEQPSPESPQVNSRSYSNSSIKSEKKTGKDKKHRSFDEVVLSHNSPRNSKDFGGSSGFSGFNSSSSDREHKGHPLPRPSFGNDHGVVLGSGSVSDSSVSSSVSSDDHAQLGVLRGQVDMKFNPQPRSPGPSRAATTSTSPRPTSPLHPRLSGESPMGRSEEGRTECHRLPLPPGSPTSPPPALPTPRISGMTDYSHSHLSKWKKGKLLGRGTFGHVYLGFNSESGQMCAIKEVRVVSDDQTSKECLKQLNQEINLLSQLSHPNIVQYYGSELNEETLSVYLEYVSGGSIHKLLQEYGPFKEPVIQNYTKQILSGLAYLHARNTVHRDIKGANILVDPNGEIKLADFGMAKHITSCSSVLSFKGSPYWMAPEVVMNTNGYSLPVDIWSLGCTVLEMAMSKPPWSQYEGVAAIFKIGNSKDLPEIPDHLSCEAKRFIQLCLQRDPCSRPSASQLLEHPFIRDHTCAKVANINGIREGLSYNLDGCRSPAAVDLHPNKTPSRTPDREHLTKPVVIAARVHISPRDSTRTITSLPVSPCSSPLRQHGPAQRSCFLSPTHPSYAHIGKGGNFRLNEYTYPIQSSTKNTLGNPWLEVPQLKTQAPSTRSSRGKTSLIV